MTKYARRCDATGRGINAGYVCGDGELYFADRPQLIAHLKTLNWIDSNGRKSRDITDDDELRDFFFDEDYFYWTLWNESDIDDVYYDENGVEYECEG